MIKCPAQSVHYLVFYWSRGCCIDKIWSLWSVLSKTRRPISWFSRLCVCALCANRNDKKAFIDDLRQLQSMLFYLMFLNHEQHATCCFVTHHVQNVQSVTAIVKRCRHKKAVVWIYVLKKKVNYHRTAASFYQLFLTRAFQTNLSCPFPNLCQL